ncbi:hypothetical protein J3F83DRAFT_132989 [Trichoderma novae-zelandiae]
MAGSAQFCTLRVRVARSRYVSSQSALFCAFLGGVCVRLWGGTFFSTPSAFEPLPNGMGRTDRADRRANKGRTGVWLCPIRPASVDSGCRAAYLHLPSAALRQTTGVRPIDEIGSALLSLQAPETCTIIFRQTQLSQPSLALKAMI